MLLHRATLAIVAITLVTLAPAHADQLAPDDLAKKNDGGYVTGLPLFAYSTDLGLGLGARVYDYWDSHRDDPRFAFILAPFFDIGRPYDSLGDLSLHDWQPSYGGAFRIAWNLATVITVDYGRSSEDTGLYINFNHIC